LKETDRCW